MAVIILAYKDDSKRLDLSKLSLNQLNAKADNQFLFNSERQYYNETERLKNLFTMTGTKQIVIIKDHIERHSLSVIKDMINDTPDARYKIYKNVEDL